MISLLLKRTVAFLLDGFSILASVIGVSLIAAIVCMFVDAGTVQGYLRWVEWPHAQSFFFAVVILFAARDYLSERHATPSALTLLGLQICFAAKTRSGRIASSLMRSSLFFVIPYAFVSYPLLPWDYFENKSTWSLGAFVATLSVASAWAPISILAGRGAVGIHDLTCGSRVMKAGEQFAPPNRRLVIRILVGYLACLIVGAILSLSLYLIFPKGSAEAERYMANVIELNLDSSGMQNRDGSSRTLRPFVEQGLLENAGRGAQALIDRHIENNVFEEIAGHILEWHVRIKRNTEPIVLRSGPTIPSKTDHLGLRVWSTRAAMADPILALSIADATASSLFRANPQMTAIYVSIENSSRVGPAVAFQSMGTWALRHPNGGAALFSSEKIVRGSFALRFGSDRLLSYSEI